MRGVFVFGNGDPQQLTAPSGSLIWFWPFLVTSFHVFYLREYVRIRDPYGAAVLDILNLPGDAERDALELTRILTKPGNCLYVSSWDDVANLETATKNVPSKKAERKIGA